MRSMIRWVVLTVFGLAAVVLVAVTAMAVLGVTIDLSHLRGGVYLTFAVSSLPAAGAIPETQASWFASRVSDSIHGCS